MWVVNVLCPPCADPTLTIDNLRLVLASVEDWYPLGRNSGGMGVPEVVRNEIRTAYMTEEEKKEALLLYYLQNVPMASWPHVAAALHRRKEDAASMVVKDFLKEMPTGQSFSRDRCHYHDT